MTTNPRTPPLGDLDPEAFRAYGKQVIDWLADYLAHPAAWRSRNEAQKAAELDRLNETLLDAVNATGKVFLSHTKLNGAFTLRLAIGNIRRDEAHVAEAGRVLSEAFRQVVIGDE